ncbi:MAG: hypothetical protein H0X29_08590 [Parachlamydiaceae bacterium]|nr:hypothetical protein [Parachlamydiaceae bacterium]
MVTSNKKINKIELTNYNYVRDIENRLLMAQLNILEVEILKEVLNGSLKFTTTQLADALDIDKSILIPVLDKLSATKLLQRTDKSVLVDKELRKYYEVQILKFDENFEPGMEFLQSLLSKVPIHILPDWYSISRTSDHIFHSIIEKYLHTPKIYERYLQELDFSDPELNAICLDVLSAPDFKLSSQYLIDKHGLSHESFEKIMLFLEFNMICCISYEMIDEKWEEMVTPFYEWREYLRFTRDTTPVAIANTLAIQRLHQSDFGFIKDMLTLLHAMQSDPVRVEILKESSEYSISLKTAKSIFEDFAVTPYSPPYLTQLVDRLQQLQLATISKQHLHITEHASEWLKLHIQDQAHSLFRLPPSSGSIMNSFSEKDIREVEKNLRRVAHSGWISFESFFMGMTIPVGDSEGINLKCKGKRWKYYIPNYSESERQFIQATLCEKLFETGMVAIGFHEDALCFSVTPFGRMSLDE